MMPSIGFGVKSSLSLPDELALTQCGSPAGTALADVTMAIRAALTDPLGYPALARSVVPGDHVAVVLGDGLMLAPRLVAGVVMELLEAGIEPELVTIIRSAGDARLRRGSPTGKLPESIQQRLVVQVHDADDRDQLCMLNVSSHDDPIYLNRAIVEADVVIPIGVARPRDCLGERGVHGVLFPTFSNTETQQRFLDPRSTLASTLRKKRMEEAREADWFLGTRLVVQVVPGRRGELMHVVAGDVDVVDRHCDRLCESLWTFPVTQRAELVVATLPGGREQQSWINFARALAAASRVVEDEGAIAICSDIRQRPGPSLRRISRAPSLEAARKAVVRDKTADALAATQLVRSLQRTQVYLLSHLDEESVQSLGLAFIESPDDVARLAARHTSCLVLENAHQAVPSVSADVPA
jgi:nickel-dependent lactate racemase